MAAPIVVNDRITIPASAIEVQAVRSSGPGGQNVNKLATRIRLWVDLAAVPALTAVELARLRTALQWRIDDRGRLQVSSQEHREQSRNLQDATRQVVELLRRALVPPKIRRRTRPPASVRRNRLEAKHHRSDRLRDRRVDSD